MLTWFVGRHAAESALTGRILTEKDVKINPASVSTACLDENISMHRIYKTLFFLRRMENPFRHLGKGDKAWLAMWNM